VDAAFVHDGKELATAGRDGVTVWSVPAANRLRVLRSPGGVSAVALSPDGSLVAAAGQDGSARLWDASTGHARGVFKVSSEPLRDVVFSPDGRVLLATGENNQTWDVRTGHQLHVLIGHTGRVVEGGFSPDGRWIVTAGPTTVGLWPREGGQPVYLRNLQQRPNKLLTAVSFSSDGRHILSASEDGSVRVYTCEVCGDLRALLRLAEARLREAKR
jgi:WD40 repeat protein